MAIDTWEEAIEIADEIIELIEEELLDDTYAKRPEFFDSVLENTKGIRETVECSEEVTENQASALENMLSGVRRWFRK